MEKLQNWVQIADKVVGKGGREFFPFPLERFGTVKRKAPPITLQSTLRQGQRNQIYAMKYKLCILLEADSCTKDLIKWIC